MDNIVKLFGLSAALSLAMTASAAAVPFNDEIGGAVLLTGTGSYSQSVQDATPSLAGQFGGTIDNDVWLTFFGDGGMIDLSTDNPGTDYDTQFFVWTGYDGSNYASLTQILYNDDIGLSLASALSFVGVAGTQYWLGIDGFSGDSGTYELSYSVGATVIPLPAALPLFLAGLAGLGFAGWRKIRNAAQV